MDSNDLYINLNNFLDLLECMRSANKNDAVRETIDSVADIAYDLAENAKLKFKAKKYCLKKNTINGNNRFNLYL